MLAGQLYGRRGDQDDGHLGLARNVGGSGAALTPALYVFMRKWATWPDGCG
jgi:hypothetical protein